MDTIIQRIAVPENRRMAAVDQLFGLLWPIYIEPLIFHLADSLASDYSGGMWTFYTLHAAEDNKAGFYIAPDCDTEFNVVCVGNQWEGTLSADALGITCCLMAYSNLSFSKNPAVGPLMAEHYHRLRDYIFDHAEVQAILGATD